VDITVSICTWNRAKLLDATLAQMCKLRIPAATDWEVLVVNNRSTDNTEAVVGQYLSQLPLRPLLEERQGVSFARNRVLAEARGKLLLCIDDDVLVDPDWLEAYQHAAEAWPDAGFFGGTIEPFFESEPPEWVLKNPKLVEAPFALRRLGCETRPLPQTELPYGANMAFRRECVRGVSFSSVLGRVGPGMIRGEESDFIRRLIDRGAHGVWVGSARVKHFVPRERLTTQYIWDFFAGMGAADVRRRGGPSGKRWFNMPRWVIRQHLENRVKSWLFALQKDDRWAAAFRESAATFGTLRELCK
jgi:glycosyltransferase involved in cell wall biosynthesis